MTFIVDKKIYDTNKAELLAEGKRQYQESNVILNCTIYPQYETKLYKTEKGNYFFTYIAHYRNYIEVTDEETAKSWLMYKNYPKYVELFGELEEG